MVIAEAIASVQERIEGACARCGRRSSDIQLMAVSKFHDGAAVQAAYDAGLRLFGESRVWEAMGKFSSFKQTHPDTRLHLIGTLQRNKARPAAALFDVIQSIDRVSLIEELANLTARRPPLPVLLELHTAEDSKSGFPDTDALCAAAESILPHFSPSGLIPAGLMTMAPYTRDERAIRASFRALVAARNVLDARFPGFWTTLSMGMSNDFEIAIEEGATLIRVGTALFGERQ
jgi:pyridoxal phosphate enzyme (YggS family)